MDSTVGMHVPQTRGVGRAP